MIHIELKRSGVPVSHAYNQIEKYSAEGVFSGLFALVQVFVAMQPSEMVYFANPGMDGKFNKDFYFHWDDFDNELINDWKGIAARFLSIPMAHQLKIDLLIVVNQMLMGFDSKWLNTLYLDKLIEYENIIQAFSRTNRLYIENEKP